MNIKQIIKKLFSESAIYALGPTLQTFVGFLLIPMYTRYLTPANYGSLEFVFAIAAFLSPIIDGGLTSSFWKFGTGPNLARKSIVIFNCRVAQIIFNILILVGAYIYSILQPASEVSRYLTLYTVVLLFRTFLTMVYLDLQSSHRVGIYVTLSITTALLIAVANILMVAYFKLGVLGIIYGNMIGVILASLIFLPWYIHSLSIQPCFDWNLMKEMYAYGLPLALGNMVFLIITTSDRFFINFFNTPNDLGLFAYGVRFSSLLNTFIIAPFFLSFNPIRWEIYARPDARQIFSTLYKIILFTLLQVFFFSVSAGMILGTFMTKNPEFIPGLTVLPLLNFSLLLFGLYYFRSMGLLFEGKTRLLSLIIIIASVVSLSSNFILVPLMSFNGAAIASTLAYIIMFVVCSALSQKYYPIQIDYGFEIIGLSMGAVLCIASVAFRHVIVPWQFGIASFMMGLIYSIISIAKHPDAFRKIIKFIISSLSRSPKSTTLPSG